MHLSSLPSGAPGNMDDAGPDWGPGPSPSGSNDDQISGGGAPLPSSPVVPPNVISSGLPTTAPFNPPRHRNSTAWAGVKGAVMGAPAGILGAGTGAALGAGGAAAHNRGAGMMASGYDAQGNRTYTPTHENSGILGRAVKGGNIGSTFGPLGAGVGAGIGALSGTRRGGTGPGSPEAYFPNGALDAALGGGGGRNLFTEPGASSYTPPEEGGFTGGKTPGPTEMDDDTRRRIEGGLTGIPPDGVGTDTAPVPPTGGASVPADAHLDGYSAPKYTAPAAGAVMPGWDATKWNDPAHQTPKYVVGRLVSQYGTDDASFAKAVADIQKAYPGTTTDGKDKVTIPGVGTIDIRTGASQGGTGWAWQPVTGPDGSPVAQGASPSGPGSPGPGTSGWDNVWAAGGAQSTTRSLIDTLMEQLALSNALK